ncbi:MAG TPA: glycosyltransferase family 1 protein [Candidatus Baltobacteraceae bacterium]|jgi:glycosyltransferase involved in cell wall biosynthesis|nr:glycosyltransferase family 1 protein [Candidatus Baltobacteraceae bacterium]
MRVGLDARLTRQMSVGMKAYARELALRLPRVAPDLQFVTFDRGGNFGWQEQIALPAAMRRANVDVVHLLSLYAPAFPPRPYVVTIHDLIHLRFPQYFKAKVGPYYHTLVRFVCSRAARVITDDPRTVQDLQRYLGVDPARTRVIPLGVDDRFLAPIDAFAAPRPYIFYAGNHRAHKDLGTIFAAWHSLPEELPLDLYVTGPDDFGNVQKTRANGRLVALGDVDDDALASYYAGARALVHPALYEGFGLPMLEAMAAGTAVIACEDSIPAVLRDCALTFPARDVAAARMQVLRILQDEGLRTRLVNEGRVRAAGFTWDRCAAATAQLYREIVEA